MIYIFCIPGTVVRRAFYSTSQEAIDIDYSVWKLLSIIKPEDFSVSYTVAEKASLEPIYN